MQYWPKRVDVENKSLKARYVRGKNAKPGNQRIDISKDARKRRRPANRGMKYNSWHQSKKHFKETENYKWQTSNWGEEFSHKERNYPNLRNSTTTTLRRTRHQVNSENKESKNSLDNKKAALREVTGEIIQTLGMMTKNMKKLQTKCFGM